MKRMFLIGFIFALFIPSLASASGVLVDAKGKVDVTLPGGAPQPGRIGLELPDGSSVSVRSDGAASVMLESGAIDDIPQGEAYKVGSEAKGAKRIELGSGLAVAMRELAAAGKDPTVHGMVKAAVGPRGKIGLAAGFVAGGINAVYPSGTSIRLGAIITFRWDPTPPVDWAKPAIVVDDANKQHIATRPVAAGSHELSIDSSNIGIKKGGAYSWYLATQEGSLKGKTSRFEFRTLSGADEKQLDGDISKIRALDMSKDGKNLLIGQIYISRGLNDDAARTLDPLWQKLQPPFVKKLLRLAYSRMGRAKDAELFR